MREKSPYTGVYYQRPEIADPLRHRRLYSSCWTRAKCQTNAAGIPSMSYAIKGTGTKFGCGMALCGACTVHLDGQATRSCITTIDSVGDAAITTIEAIGTTPAGQKVQRAWLDLEVVQCGYCQSGQIMSAAALLAENAAPDRRRHRRGDVRQHLPLRDLCADPRGHQACAAPTGREADHARGPNVVDSS